MHVHFYNFPSEWPHIKSSPIQPPPKPRCNNNDDEFEIRVRRRHAEGMDAQFFTNFKGNQYRMKIDQVKICAFLCTFFSVQTFLRNKLCRNFMPRILNKLHNCFCLNFFCRMGFCGLINYVEVLCPGSICTQKNALLLS